jgi:hypothetical protein
MKAGELAAEGVVCVPCLVNVDDVRAFIDARSMKSSRFYTIMCSGGLDVTPSRSYLMGVPEHGSIE